MKPENFGKNLGDILKFIDMSQNELSIKTGLTRAAISQIINGHREPGLKSVCLILKVIPSNFERLVR